MTLRRAVAILIVVLAAWASVSAQVVVTAPAVPFLASSTPGPTVYEPVPGQKALNYFRTGQWVEYRVVLPQAGRSRIDLQVSNEVTSPSRWRADLDGVRVGVRDVAPTGSWSTYRWQEGPTVLVGAGAHTLRITADQQYFNLMAVRVTLVEPAVGGFPAPYQ